MPAMLEINSLTAGYGGGTVLDGLSLTVAEAEVVAVLGRNGAGKTTLLLTIMGLIRPQRGEIHFNGERIDGRQSFEIARRGVTIVPQGREVFADLSVEENLRLGALRGGALDEAFGLFPTLATFRDVAAGQLSGGQQQQLAIARALLTNPKLLLLDEPSEGIQPSIVQDIARVIGDVARRKKIAIILVEQNVDLALSLASRALILDDGILERDIAAEDFRRDPGLVERHMVI